MPMWFRRLQGQGNASALSQSEAEPRPVRCRWAERAEPVIICSSSSPSREMEDDEEEEDFHPQSLEELLGEEEEDEEEGEKQAGVGGAGGSYVLYDTNAYSDRDFTVEGVANPQQLESKGQGAEPAWSAHLSADSSISDGSTGSLEQQPDADTDSLSQGSSAGSLEENHLGALASSGNQEKFDTDLRSLQPTEEQHFLNPRLSISTRFLARFQDRIRAWPTRAPPGSLPTSISEENISNTSASSDLSSEVIPQEHTQDVSSRTQGGGVAGGYLGTTASSRAKLCSELLPEGHDLLGSGVDPHQEQRRIVSAQSVQATPTDVMSLGSSGCSINGFGTSDASLTLLECQRLADELKQVVRRAVGFHQQLSVSLDASESRHQKAAVLQEAFQAATCELQGALQPPGGQLEDDRLMFLLEKYSDQLVQVTQNKLSRL